MTDAQADCRIRLKAYDESGARLSYQNLVKRMTNHAGYSYLKFGTFDIPTLEAVQINHKSNSRELLTIPVAASTADKHGIMIYWDTENTGYSTYLLTNAGAGFSENATILLNKQLALDAKDQFNKSLSDRPDFTPSADLNVLFKAAEACFARLDLQRDESESAQVSQQCLDLTARSMQGLLKEYGMQRARVLASQAKWGVTIRPTERDINAEYRKIDDLVALFDEKHRWIRIAMEPSETFRYPHIRQIIDYAAQKNVRVMGQLFDSSSQASISLSDFKALVDVTLAYPGFEKFDAWEIGNEVNGGWLGPDMKEKIEYAASKVKSLFPRKHTCLTFYWQLMPERLSDSLFNWIAENMTEAIVKNIDWVALSIYMDQNPLGFSWDPIMTRLATLFPGKEIMVGEMGFIDSSVETIFREGKLTWSETDGAARYIRNRYAASFATPSSTGGGFWWYYDTEMVGRTGLWDTMRTLYCEVYPDKCDRVLTEVLYPKTLTMLQGKSSGELDSLAVMDQTGLDDDSKKNIYFKETGSNLKAQLKFSVPADLDTHLLTGMKVKINWLGPHSDDQAWSWSLKNVNSSEWDEVGGNFEGGADWLWTLFSTRIDGDASRYIGTDHKIVLQYKTSNGSNNSNIDFLGLELFIKDKTPQK